jgi:hypothetical protein
MTQRTKEQRDLQIYEAGFSQLVSYTESLVLLNGSGNVLEQQAIHNKISDQFKITYLAYYFWIPSFWNYVQGEGFF